MKIINLTPYAATQEQLDAGVFEPSERCKQVIRAILTFEKLPEPIDVYVRAMDLAKIASLEGADAAMIGGEPYLMRPLSESLHIENIQPLYAFFRRESVDEAQADGSVAKRTVAHHLGFVQG